MFLLAAKQIFPIRIFLIKQGFFLFGKIFRIISKKKQDFFLVKRNSMETTTTDIMNTPYFIAFVCLVELNLSCFFVNRNHD